MTARARCRPSGQPTQRRAACDHPAMPAPPSSAARPGRRAVLRAGLVAVTGAGVLGLSGCRLRVGGPDRTPSTVAPEPTADELALDRARLRADQLAVTYAQAARLRMDLATPLRQLAAD